MDATPTSDIRCILLGVEDEEEDEVEKFNGFFLSPLLCDLELQYLRGEEGERGESRVRGERGDRNDRGVLGVFGAREPTGEPGLFVRFLSS